MNDHRGNFNKRVETIRKNQMAILEIKTTVTKTKNDFDRLISKLNTGNNKLEDRSIEIIQIETQREK